jgi:hypothetical protein
VDRLQQHSLLREHSRYEKLDSMRFTNIIALGLAATGSLAAPKPVLDDTLGSVSDDFSQPTRLRKEWYAHTL